MGRIQKVSKFFRAMMLAFLIVYGAAVLAEVIVIPVAALHPPILKSQTVFNNCGGFICVLFGFMVVLNFFRLFTRLRDGHLFEGETIQYLEQAGKWWIALGTAEIIYQSLQVFIFPPHNMNINMSLLALSIVRSAPADLGSSNNVNITGGGAIFAGLVVFFIAWVLREGQKLKEEQELTV